MKNARVGAPLGIRVNFDLENNFLFAGLTLIFNQNIWFDFYTIEKK